MSTIEKILESLQRTSQDKKHQLTKSYQEKSVWLQNEFAVIKQLIKQNPRENIRAERSVEQTKEELFCDPSAKDAPSSSFIPAAAVGATKESEDAASRKRKSPEQELNAVKLSPEQKRTSFDIEELLQDAGLPADLNRLKKEQLLSALEEYDPSTTLNMKSLKKDLIDALKNQLVENRRRQIKIGVSKQLNSSDALHTDAAEESVTSSPAEDAFSVAAPLSSGADTPGTVGRKVSLMSDFRSRVQRESQIGSGANASGSARLSMENPDWKKKIETAYQARMSHARKSQLAELPPKPETAEAEESSAAPSAPKSELAQSSSSINSSTSGSLVLNAIDLCSTSESQLSVGKASETALAAAATLSDTIDTSASAAEDATEEERSEAPAEGTDKSGEENMPGVALAEEDDDKSVMSEATNATAGVWMEIASPNRNGQNESAANDEGSKAIAAAKPSVASAAAAKKIPAAGSKDIKSEKSSSAMSSVKRPVNPVGGAKMTSFNVNKQVIPALQKAKQAKLAEEQRALQKKKEQEQRHAAAAANANAASLKSSTQSQKAATKPVSTSAASSADAKTDTSTSAVAEAVEAPAVATVTATASDAAAQAPASSNENQPAPTPAPEKKKAGGIFGLFSSATKSAVSAVSSASSAPSASSATDASNGVKLKEGISNKSVISSIVQNYNNALQGKSTTAPPAAPVYSATAVPPPAAPTPGKVLSKAPIGVVAASSGVLKDITASAVVASTAAKLQQQKQQAQMQSQPEEPVQEYVIEDRESSDDDGSGTDDEKEQKNKAQSIPDWARGSKLKEQLERQYGLVPGVPAMDPDSIFPEVVSCDLEEIFGCSRGVNRKYSHRTSSAQWDADKLTLVEKRAYRKHMGYDRHQQQQPAAH